MAYQNNDNDNTDYNGEPSEECVPWGVCVVWIIGIIIDFVI